ncbi:MAG: winged helix-turn-helix domain-containing protein, partial [Pseudomonas sp.]
GDATHARATAKRRSAQAAAGRSAKKVSNDLDRLIHERTRLAMVSALAANESLSFNDLKGLLGASDGNLSAHARKLEDAGYIACAKSFEGRLPKTDYQLTESGKQALNQYITHMEALIRAVKKS